MNPTEIALAAFSIGEIYEKAPFGNGHINRTEKVTASTGEYILQRLNTYVFREPEKLMDNLLKVTEHIRKKAREAGMVPERCGQKVILTREGMPYLWVGDSFYRLLRIVPHSIAINHPETPRDLYETGKCFGRFSGMMADFPAEELYETIPDFHHTPKRFAALKRAAEANGCDRLRECERELSEALSWEAEAGSILSAIEAGEVPLRVTHNDTKINNALLDETTREGLCVIDLDTVMPGSLLYDFGEGIRTSATHADEDEEDEAKIDLSMECFRAFTEGFLSQTGEMLTSGERRLLAVAPRIMTVENAIRFLTDYLEGDVYFHIDDPLQNLRRCRMHLHLANKMKDREDEMREIILAASRNRPE